MFIPCNDVASLPLLLSLDPGEEVVGWYRNPPPWAGTVVIFTSLAVYVGEDGHFTRTALQEIVDYELPKDKVGVMGVRIRSTDGFCFVRMAGRYGPLGKFGDVFNLIMILQVLASRAKRPSH